MTPGTSFAGTLPANGLTPCVPGMAWPGVLELGVAPDCAKDSVVPYRKTPASKSMQLGPKLSFTGASSASHLVQRLCQGKICYSCRRFRATRICAAHFGCPGKQEKYSLFRILVHGTYLPGLQTHPDRDVSTVCRCPVSFLQSGLNEKFHGCLGHYKATGDAWRPKDFLTMSQSETDSAGLLSIPYAKAQRSNDNSQASAEYLHSEESSRACIHLILDVLRTP